MRRLVKVDQAASSKEDRLSTLENTTKRGELGKRCSRKDGEGPENIGKALQSLLEDMCGGGGGRNRYSRATLVLALVLAVTAEEGFEALESVIGDLGDVTNSAEGNCAAGGINRPLHSERRKSDQ